MALPLDHTSVYVWRVSNYEDLSGLGGLLAEGRWHSRGHPVVYCADSVGNALKEVERHLGVPPFLFPDTYKVLHVRLPGIIKFHRIDAAELTEGWRDRYEVTQEIGDQWLRSMHSPVMVVPSAITDGVNYVINSAHREAGHIKVVEVLLLNEFIVR